MATFRAVSTPVQSAWTPLIVRDQPVFWWEVDAARQALAAGMAIILATVLAAGVALRAVYGYVG